MLNLRPLHLIATLVLIPTSGFAQSGRVYPVDAVSTPTTSDLLLPAIDAGAPQFLTGFSGQLQVTNYVSGDPGTSLVVEQALEPNAGPHFLYDPPFAPTDGFDAFAQVNAYYHAARGLVFYTSILGLDLSGPESALVVAANAQTTTGPLEDVLYLTDGIAGPFAAPNLIAVGQGGSFDFAQDSDPILRAIHLLVSHRMLGFNAGPFALDPFGFSPFGEAIDQGIADYFAASLNNDPVIGQASYALLGNGRDLTAAPGVCRDDLTGIALADSQFLGHFAWTLRVALGETNTDRLIWDTAALLPATPSMQDFAVASLAAADALVVLGDLSSMDRDLVLATANNLGLSDCGRQIDLSPEAPSSLRAAGLDAFAAVGAADCATLALQGAAPVLFQHRILTSPTDSGFTIGVNAVPDGATTPSLDIFARSGAQVGFAPGATLPAAAIFDHELLGATTPAVEFTIDGNSSPPFVPGSEYFVAVSYTACEPADLLVSVQQLGAPQVPSMSRVGLAVMIGLTSLLGFRLLQRRRASVS